MSNSKWIVKDSYGKSMRVFLSLKYAEVYKETAGKKDWTIEKMK